MKKLSPLFFALILTFSLNAQDSAGIQFSKTTWAETLSKAKEENKIIFVDAYTSWCGPCKMMARDVFPLEDVGKFYNENFINVKIDMEKGEGILFAKAYDVYSYPTYLYIDHKGSLMHRAVGFRAKDDFIDIGGTAQNEETRLSSFMEKHKSGEFDAAFLRDYSDKLAECGMGAEASEVAKEYLNTQKDWLTPENTKFILNHAQPTAEDKFFKFVLANRTTFYKHNDEGRIDDMIMYSVRSKLYKEKGQITDADLETNLKEIMPEKADQLLKFYQVEKHMYAKGEGAKEAFRNALVEYTASYEIKGWQKLNSIAWRIYEMFDDEETLKMAREMALKSVNEDSNYYNNDTLAAICFKLKEKDAAIKHANIAITLAEKDGHSAEETKQLLEKIQTLD